MAGGRFGGGASKLSANVETSLRDADAEAKVCHSIGRLLCGGRPKCFRGDEFGAGGEWCQSASFETPCSVAIIGAAGFAYHCVPQPIGATRVPGTRFASPSICAR